MAENFRTSPSLVVIPEHQAAYSSSWSHSTQAGGSDKPILGQQNAADLVSQNKQALQVISQSGAGVQIIQCLALLSRAVGSLSEKRAKVIITW